MNTDRKYTYVEETSAPVWVLVVLWGALLAAYFGVDAALGASEEAGPLMKAMPAVYLLIGGLFHLLFGKLSVGLTRDEIELWFGMGLIRKRFAIADVQSVEAVTYRPLMEFGGWGIRGWGNKKAWTMSGNRAVVLTLPDNAKFYIGSDTPERLRERIAAAMPRPPKDDS